MENKAWGYRRNGEKSAIQWEKAYICGRTESRKKGDKTMFQESIQHILLTVLFMF